MSNYVLSTYWADCLRHDISVPYRYGDLRDLRVARFRCHSSALAAQFRDHLTDEGIPVQRIEDDTVFVFYEASMEFVSRAATEAVLHGFADASEMDKMLDVAQMLEERLAIVSSARVRVPSQRRNPSAHLYASGIVFGT
jgi:hypothetical protein